jgi:luciferase family oxidoreductase group 1
VLYSVLDIYRTPAETTELVRFADRLGFHRYWVGEHHHAMQCPNPLLLAAVLLGLTARIRIGTGALGLLARSPLVIAEDVNILRTLYGDRFDLGVTPRLVGDGPGTRDLLLDGRDESAIRKGFPERLRSLASLLTEGLVPALPGHDDGPPVLWLVGSSQETARTAASLGIGFCTSLFHARSLPDLDTALATYRQTFRPAAHGLPEPYVILVLSGVCAAPREAGQEAVRAFFEADKDGAQFQTRPVSDWHFAGDGGDCREALAAAIARFQPDELMIHNLVPDSPEMDLRSLALLAVALDLHPDAPAAPQ